MGKNCSPWNFSAAVHVAHDLYTHINVFYTTKRTITAYELDFIKRNTSEIFKSMYSLVPECVNFWFCSTTYNPGPNLLGYLSYIMYSISHSPLNQCWKLSYPLINDENCHVFFFQTKRKILCLDLWKPCLKLNQASFCQLLFFGFHYDSRL